MEASSADAPSLSLGANTRAEQRLFRHVTLTALLLLGAGGQLEATLRLYAPAAGDQASWAAALALGGAAIGLALGWRAPRPSRAVAWWQLTAALAQVGMGWAVFASFASGQLAVVTALAAPSMAALVLGSAAARWALTIALPATELGLASWLVNPFRLLGALLVMTVVAALGAWLGELRATFLIGCGLAIGATWTQTALHYLYRQPALGYRRLAVGAVAAGVVAAGALWWIEQHTPLSERGAYPSEVVYATSSDRQRYVVTEGAGSLDLFVDSHLELSALDAHRFHEALVHPLLGSVPERAQVLLLGGCSGAAAREVLRHQRVAQLTAICPDAELSRLVARMPWAAELAAGSMSDPRVRVVQAEPSVWLAESRALFDAVVVLSPPPLGYREGKHYTAHFFALVRDHLRAGGAAALSLAPSVATPGTVAEMLATVEAAGLVTLPYVAGVPTLGEWTFALAGRERPEMEAALPAGLAFLTAPALRQLADAAPSAPPAEPAPRSTLHQQRIVRRFLSETGSATAEAPPELDP